jgi:hypothetical protein
MAEEEKETFAWAFWATGANALLLFLYVLSVSIAWVAGQYVLNSVVMGAVAFLLPFASFWLFPPILIVARAFSETPLVQ